jgi:hypothetical protein
MGLALTMSNGRLPRHPSTLAWFLTHSVGFSYVGLPWPTANSPSALFDATSEFSYTLGLRMPAAICRLGGKGVKTYIFQIELQSEEDNR